jgi:hypothetical protein
VRLAAIRDRSSVVIALLAVLVGASVLWTAHRDRDRVVSDLADAETQVEELGGGVERLAGQIEAMGEEPVVEVDRTGDVPELTEPEQGEPGEAGEQGGRGERGEAGEDAPPISDEQVEVALARYCDTNPCEAPPTATQVVAALATYCDARGECRGERGSDGSDGGDGRDGQDGTDGADGPPPTGEQIAAGLESYCASRDGCAGPRGPAGADGRDGEDSTVPGPKGDQGDPGPTCPDGTDPIEWTVSEARSAVVGLDPGDYLVCQADANQGEP